MSYDPCGQVARTAPSAVLYAFCALFMLILSNLFPFVNMTVAGIKNAITLIEIPRVLVSEDYASMASLFMIFVQLVPAFCMVAVILLNMRVPMPTQLKVMMAKVLFKCRSWCMVEIFLAGVLVSFVKLMAYGDVGVGSSFLPYCLFCVLQVRVFQVIDKRILWSDILPAPKHPENLRVGVTGIQQGLRACTCCSAILPADQLSCHAATRKAMCADAIVCSGPCRFWSRLSCSISLLTYCPSW